MAGWFGYGGKDTIAIGADVSGNLVFKDEVVVGTKTLTELFGDTWRVVPAGETRTIKAWWDHVCSEMTIEDTGTLFLEDNARLVLV